MKFSKKLKALAVAIPMMALSTAAAVSGTVAWFVASNVVTVTGPTVQAEAEDGIVIANELEHSQNSHWGQKVTVSYHPSASYIPTSTVDSTKWYHAYAENVDSQAAGTEPENVVKDITSSITRDSTTGIGKWDINNTNNDINDDKNMYLLNKLYIQASGQTALTTQKLVVENVSITDSTVTSQALNKSLRVLFVHAGAKCLYAPLAAESSVTYGVGTTSDRTNSVTAYKEVNTSTYEHDILASSTTIPAFDVNGTGALEIDVYVYFEGEDSNCKSANIVASLDTISLQFKFKNIKVSN